MTPPRRMAKQAQDVAKGALESIPPFIVNALVAIISALVTVYVTLQNNDSSRYAADREANVETIKALYAQIRQLETKVFELTSQVTRYQIELSKTHGEHAELIEVLEKSPNVAWVNRVEVAADGSVRFPMMYINPLYTYVHGVSLERYKGQTEDKVWPPDVAAAFRKNNLRVLAQKDGFCTYESYPRRSFIPVGPDNPIGNHQVCKWLINLGNGEQAIVGMATVDPIEAKE
jgi:hypothetical protein